ncbi:nicotinamide mononucleotide permease [Fusarium heterosporum]|uniref:Nicotinamide mononucleotide permease n=1 Tax=Fusarium heterosporum TaxID=42747 RepID=A0A8H5WPY9_FUSHE|nr:nicotinamide mononucleotide permease [Fusarium heterosporum]
MPTYLCHGFRWHRRDIRIFVILNDLEDAAPNWLLAPATSYCVLDQLHAKYDFLPELSPPTTPTQDSFSIATNNKLKEKFDHVDDDHAIPISRVLEDDDAVLMHSWSPVRLLEEYDVDDMVTACRPYAYVADHVIRIDLSADVAGQMAKYYQQMAGEDGWIVKLRDELQKGEPVKWYVVVCGDEVRDVPGKSDEEEREVGYEQIRDAAQTMVRTRRGRGILEGFSDSPSESPSEYDEAEGGDQDDALTVLEDILDGSGASTPRPLSQELPDFDIPLQPRPDPTRASVITTSTVWSQDDSPNSTSRHGPLYNDSPIIPHELNPNRISVSNSSVWSRKESSDDELGLSTPGVELPLLQSENTRYSTSTASGLHSEYGERHVEPRDFLKQDSLAASPIQEEVPDIIQPLMPHELRAPRSSTPPTPKTLKPHPPIAAPYKPRISIPQFPPTPSGPKASAFNSSGPAVPNETGSTKPPETSWPLSSESPLESSGSSTYHNEETPLAFVPPLMPSKARLPTTFHLSKEAVPPRTPPPRSEHILKPQTSGPGMPRFEETVPHGPALLVSQNPPHLEQPSSGVLYEGGETASERQPSSIPLASKVTNAPAPKINTTKEMKASVPTPPRSLAMRSFIQQQTPDYTLKSSPRNTTTEPSTQRSPNSRIPRSIPKPLRLSSVPLPPEPEVKTPVRPPTPPKSRTVQRVGSTMQRGGSERRPQTAPEKADLSKPNTRTLSMPHRYETPSSVQELESGKVAMEPTPPVISNYSRGVKPEPSAPLDATREVRMRAPQPPLDTGQNRKTSESTEHSDGLTHEGEKNKHRHGRTHSVAAGFKRLFRKPSQAKGTH